MQKECESALKRINKEIEEFDQRKEQEFEEIGKWKQE